MKFFTSVFSHLKEEQEKTRFGLDLFNTLSNLEINFRIQYCDKNKLSEENAHNNITCISQWNETETRSFFFCTQTSNHVVKLVNQFP